MSAACRTGLRVSLFVFGFWAPNVLAQSHPFLIVREDMYAELQARASEEPWASWKTSAMNYDAEFDLSQSYISRSNRLTRIVSRAALAYILDEARRPLYVQRIVTSLTTGWANLAPGLDASVHGTVVPPGAAFFNSVLALDVIYNDLSTEQRTSLESSLKQAADFYLNTTTSWKLNLYGNRLIWGLYTGDRTLTDKARADYLDQLQTQLSPDGVFVAGPGYAAARLGHARDAKTHAIDVLEFTGEAQLYTDASISDFYEWLYGYSVTPFRKRYSFGDTSPDRNSLPNGPRAVSAYRFSDAAARYASWNLNGDLPATSLLGYVLMEEPMREAVLPTSRVFPDGGAFFREPTDSPEALSGALNNVMTDGGHTHKETNAVHLAAYGEHLLRNSGYKGWGTGAFGFDWTYVNRTAKSGNVMTANQNDHLTKVGGGIAEYLIGSGFDYASGNSGQALMGGRHWRNFCLVHSSSEATGYFLLFDEIFPASGTQTADLYLHPNSDQTDVVEADETYTWTIGSFNTGSFDSDPGNDDLDVRFTENGVQVTLFLATPPSSTSIERGLLAQWDNSFVGEYLHATYPVDGYTGVLTLVLPHDESHRMPAAVRSSGPYHSGVRLSHGAGAVDYAAVSTSDSAFSIGRVNAQGIATWFREQDDAVTSFFLRKGTRFDSPSFGISVEAQVSFLLEGQIGQIVSPGTNMTMRAYQTYDIALSGVPLPILSSGADWIEVFVPEGKHAFELVPLASPVLSVLPALSLGEIPSDRTSSEQLTIENVGEGPMIISEVRSDLEGFASTETPIRVEPSATVTLQVLLSGGPVGPFTGTLEIVNNSADQPIVVVEISGSFVVVHADMRADFDGSGVVDFIDFLSFAQAFGSSDTAFDIDGNGIVDFGDFLIFAESFGRAVSG
jgi:hypothetical protein